MHPFIDIMVKLLAEAQARSSRPGVLQSIMFGSEREYREDTKELWRQCVR